MKKYIAVDIGASSGRLMLGELINEKIILNEIHRFNNSFSFNKNYDKWNIDKLVEEIFIGLEKAKKNGINDCYLGIDTWAVDYVLVDREGLKIDDPISYRDKRTSHQIEELTKNISREEIYQKTGIQFIELNTLYQLYVEEKEKKEKSQSIMLVPDYIGFVLTGKKVTETTNASTTQMINLEKETFDEDLLDLLGISKNQFSKLVEPGNILGKISDKWIKKYNIPNVEVVTVASHDTASAVVGTPFRENNSAFLSSGTWSLLGTELENPITTKAAFENNFTNEKGAYGMYRFLKNIMGLWIVQEVSRLYDYRYSFAEMAELASQTPFFKSIINVNDMRFNNPENMIKEIQDYCVECKQPVPRTVGEITNCIYSSLAISYQDELKKLQEITKIKLSNLYIVGGGSNVAILNQLTANLTGLNIYSGPGEATAIGNLLVQMITTKDIKNIEIGRNIIYNSFTIKKYIPLKMEEDNE